MNNISEKQNHSCSVCEHFYYSAPQHDQPYPEFTCTVGCWQGIGSKEELDELSQENDCDLFSQELPLTPSNEPGK